jgi:hypothetical protein
VKRIGEHTNLRRLAVCESSEESGVLVSFVVCPCRIGLQGKLKHISFYSYTLLSAVTRSIGLLNKPRVGEVSTYLGNSSRMIYVVIASVLLVCVRKY